MPLIVEVRRQEVVSTLHAYYYCKMKSRELTSEIWLPATVSAVFEFFSNAANLNEITPPWLHFRIINAGAILMKPGALIDYRLKIHGIPVSWQSGIETWKPPHLFIDTQRKGPYRKWIHTHQFEESDNGTLVKDKVEYALHGWIFESLVDRILVKPDLRRIFEYRKSRLAEIFRKERINGAALVEL